MTHVVTVAARYTPEETKKMQKSARTRKGLIGIPCAMLVGLMLTSCTPQAAKQSVIETGNGNTVAISEGAASLPANFPLPIYPGSKAAASLNSSDKASGTATVVLSTEDEPDIVSAYYQKELKERGWTIENTMTMEQMSTIQAKKDEDHATIMVASENGEHGKTTITLSVLNQ